MITQRCDWITQEQPFMAHIPAGLVVSTMHSRNARYHRNTIARSHLISPSRALNTLRLTLIATIPDRGGLDHHQLISVDSSSLMTTRSFALQNDALARNGNPVPLPIHSTDRSQDTVANIAHLYSLSTCNFHWSIPRLDREGGSSPPVIDLVVPLTIDDSALREGNWRPAVEQTVSIRAHCQRRWGRRGRRGSAI